MLGAVPVVHADAQQNVRDTHITFETAVSGSLPSGWSTDGPAAQGATASVCDNVAFEGQRSLRIVPADGRSGGGVVWAFDTAPYRGSVVRLALAIRSPSDRPPQLALDIARPHHAAPFRGRLAPVGDAKDGWMRYEIEAGIALDAQPLSLAINVGGESWIDDVLVTRVASLTDRPSELTRVSAAALAKADATPFSIRSQLLSDFLHRDTLIRASVVVPDGVDVAALPVCYSVHGFGGDHIMGLMAGGQLKRAMRDDDAPKMVYVFLDASCPLGHHEFADSANNGPWGRALVEEFLPALEAKFGGVRPTSQRFVTGHSSGGWSALWLQVTYPDSFAACWATSPDPVDFRDWSGVDLYASNNVFVDSTGAKRPLVMRGTEVKTTLEDYVREEMQESAIGGQMASFDAVFSPRGADGQPRLMFDRTTGAIDHTVVDAWKRYDIGLTLRTHWKELGPKLKGKIHVWCGDQDTYRLEGAVKLLQQDLKDLGSDADILLVPGRDHGSIMAPHETLWPKGMLARVHREMVAMSKAAG